MSKRYTITAALPYTNGPIHIGHLAGVYIPADIYSRFLRIKGNDVLFVCGSDEHGVPITLKAKKDGINPQDVVDKYHKIIKDSFVDFGISFDNYSRTSSKTHHKTASDFFTKLNDNNQFDKIESEQFYDKSEDQFLADRFIIGICPKCHNTECYGDQCEKCGASHNAIDLINPKSSITGLSPELKKTTHWYLKLDSHQSFLEDWILKSHKLDWKPNVYGQCKSWLDDGLKPRAVTRDLEWGVPVPLESANGKVLYVWFDAPIGYISSTIEWAKNNNKNIHFLGLISDGGVHSHINHLKALIDIAKDYNIESYIHGFTDGRDVDPKSGSEYISDLNEYVKNSSVQIASITGRYYAMDRDNRWERIKLAYDALVNAEGEKSSNLISSIENNYANGCTDEFIKHIIKVNSHNQPISRIKNDDVVIFFNFRTDRGRELTKVL